MTKIELISELFQKYNHFNDSALVSANVDAGDNLCLELSPVWHGSTHRYDRYEGEDIFLKFSGIKNVGKVLENFKLFPNEESEIGYLGLDTESLKWHSGTFKFVCKAERRDYVFTFTGNSVNLEKT